MKYKLLFILNIAALLHTPTLYADTVTDWNTNAITIIGDAIKPPGVANRAAALVQTSVYAAVNSITKRYPATEAVVDAPADASVDAAIAAANRQALSKLIPNAAAAIDEAYNKALSGIPAGEARDAGIAVGTQAADAVFALRAKDKMGVPESYRPLTTPGAYVPTVTPVSSTWSANRLPWTLTSVDQFRPDAPPALDSETWAADYNEIKEIGALNSKTRTPEQSAAAQFWVATSPVIYYPVIRSVTGQEGRDLTRNARLFAMASQSIDDSLIAVFEAKYHYSFWRPMTAIRNGDMDDNDATERVAEWKPMVNTPMHPEYPCAHCIVSSTLGNTLKVDLGDDPVPVLSTFSPTADGATRSWETIDAFIQEVSNARVWEGVHYRTSAQVGVEMGKKIAEQVAAGYPVMVK